MGFGLTVGLGTGRDADTDIQDGVEALHVKVDCLSALIYLAGEESRRETGNTVVRNVH